MENKAGRYILYIFLNKVNVENKVIFNLKWAMVNQNTFNKIIMREITTFPQKWFFFLFLIDLAPHIVILCALEF